MTIYCELNNELKIALKGKDEETKNYVRSIKAKIDEYLVANRLDREKAPGDDIVAIVIAAHKKSLEKGVAQLEKGGERSAGLVGEYKGEIEFCEKYLPDASEEESAVETIVDEAIKELGVSNVKQAGRVIGHIMKTHKDIQLNGATVKNVVMKKLQG